MDSASAFANSASAFVDAASSLTDALHETFIDSPSSLTNDPLHNESLLDPDGGHADDAEPPDGDQGDGESESSLKDRQEEEPQDGMEEDDEEEDSDSDDEPPQLPPDWFLNRWAVMSRDREMMWDSVVDSKRIATKPVYWAPMFQDLCKYLPACPPLRDAFAVMNGVDVQTRPIFYVVDGFYLFMSSAAQLNPVFKSEGAAVIWDRIGEDEGCIIATTDHAEALRIAADHRFVAELWRPRATKKDLWASRCRRGAFFSILVSGPHRPAGVGRIAYAQKLVARVDHPSDPTTVQFDTFMPQHLSQIIWAAKTQCATPFNQNLPKATNVPNPEAQPHCPSWCPQRLPSAFSDQRSRNFTPAEQEGDTRCALFCQEKVGIFGCLLLCPALLRHLLALPDVRPLPEPLLLLPLLALRESRSQTSQRLLFLARARFKLLLDTSQIGAGVCAPQGRRGRTARAQGVLSAVHRLDGDRVRGGDQGAVVLHVAIQGRRAVGDEGDYGALVRDGARGAVMAVVRRCVGLLLADAASCAIAMEVTPECAGAEDFVVWHQVFFGFRLDKLPYIFSRRLHVTAATRPFSIPRMDDTASAFTFTWVLPSIAPNTSVPKSAPAVPIFTTFAPAAPVFTTFPSTDVRPQTANSRALAQARYGARNREAEQECARGRMQRLRDARRDAAQREASSERLRASDVFAEYKRHVGRHTQQLHGEVKDPTYAAAWEAFHLKEPPYNFDREDAVFVLAHGDGVLSPDEETIEKCLRQLNTCTLILEFDWNDDRAVAAYERLGRHQYKALDDEDFEFMFRYSLTPPTLENMAACGLINEHAWELRRRRELHRRRRQLRRRRAGGGTMTASSKEAQPVEWRSEKRRAHQLSRNFNGGSNVDVLVAQIMSFIHTHSAASRGIGGEVLWEVAFQVFLALSVEDDRQAGRELLAILVRESERHSGIVQALLRALQLVLRQLHDFQCEPEAGGGAGDLDVRGLRLVEEVGALRAHEGVATAEFGGMSRGREWRQRTGLAVGDQGGHNVEEVATFASRHLTDGDRDVGGPQAFNWFPVLVDSAVKRCESLCEGKKEKRHNILSSAEVEVGLNVDEVTMFASGHLTAGGGDLSPQALNRLGVLAGD
ncbi:hypothetical protein C8R46DRAFT_1043778 [Mycena filopes]|nr:hypothetical protein C8R46DRAFT_1043778 [Mycena filopes]